MSVLQPHLIINHISLIGLPLSLIFLAIGLIKKSDLLKKSTLLVLVGLSLIIIPTYLTGEPAEESIENNVTISKDQIHTHEEAAEAALTLTLITGALSALTLLLWNKKPRELGIYFIIISALISTISLGITAHEGGKIRHSETISPKNTPGIRQAD